MLQTTDELLQRLADTLRARRIAQGWTQHEAAERSGVPYRTWRRLETACEGSIRHLVMAAVALRCEDRLALLFPAPAAGSMDELLARQAQAEPRPRERVSRRRKP